MTSLRSKIIISTLLMGLLIITGSYLLIQDIQTGIIEKDFRDKGYLLANNLALQLASPVLVNDLVEVRNSIEDIKNSYPDIEYIFVTDSRGMVLAHTFDNGFPRELQNNSKPANVMKEYVFSTEKDIIHEFDSPLFKNIGYVHVGVSESGVRAQILESSRRLLLLSVSAMALLGVFIYFTGRWLTEPILRLTEGARKINDGVLDQRIEISSHDELGVLSTTFNDMAESLAQKMKDLVASKEQTENAQRYLETLFDRIQDGIIVLNVDHKIIKMNESFLDMMGLTQEQVMGKSCQEVIFGDRQPDQGGVCSIDTMLQTKKPIRAVHEIDIGGNKKILDISGSLFSDSRGEINLILVLRDVTAQKSLENEIILRNKELTVMNDISKIISQTFDLNKILSQTLENLLKLSGMEAGEIYIKNEESGEFTSGVHFGKKENEIPVDLFEHIVKSDKAVTTEIARTVGASVSFVGVPLKSKDKVLGIIVLNSKGLRTFSARDLELFLAIGSQLGVAIENINFYNNIKYLSEFNEEILNNVNLAIHVVDKNMRILAINDELINLSRGRLKKERLINKNLFEVFPFLKEKHVDREYEYIIKNGELFQSEEKTEYYGDTIYTSTSKIPIKDKNGNVEKIITVMKDVSDQKRLEEELKDSYDELKLTYLKLKELYRLKDNFLSNMSHELRTPLTAVIGYTELMLEDNVTPEQRRKLEIILRNSNRLSGMIKSLLDTAVIESRNLALDIRSSSLHEILNQVTEDIKTAASIKNIPIYIEVPKRLTVEGDKDRLMQVFSNILDNAIKFTIKGRIKITAEEENEWVHVKFDDTGIGIPEDKLELIFDRFYQLDSSYGQKNNGTGLGLWISKNIVEAHRGKIWAESKNRGSTFHVLLPKGINNE